MPFSPNTQSLLSTNEVLSLGFMKTHHWGKTVANEVQIGSDWEGLPLWARPQGRVDVSDTLPELAVGCEA